MRKTPALMLMLGTLSLFACAQGPEDPQTAAGMVESPLTAATYTVGPGQTYATIAALPALKPGDIVDVMGNASYGAVMLRTSGTASAPITFRGVRVNGLRPAIKGGTNTVDFELSNYVVFTGFDISGGSSRCVFNHAANVTISDTVVHDCPAHGILGADNDSGSLTLDHVEVHHSGLGDQKHPIYIATDEVAHPGSVFRMQFCYLHDNNGGHGVKSRAERNEIYYNWIEGSYYHELELIGPDGPPENLKREDSDVVGNVIRKAGPNAKFHAVRIGGDGTGQTFGRYRFVNNTFLLAPGSGSALRLFDGVESVEAHNNVFYRDGGGTIELVRTVEATGTPAVYGTHNWAVTGSPIPTGWSGTITGTTPGVGSMSGLDLRPVGGGAIIDQGQLNPPAFASHPFVNPLGTPADEPARAANSTAARRQGTDAIDIGAFEGAGTGGTTTTTPPPATTPPATTPPATTPPPPPTTACLGATANGSTVVKDAPMAPKTGHFAATMTVTPSMAYMDGAVMLGAHPMSSWSDGAVIALFDGSGIIKARKGGAYAADVAMTYQPGYAYQVRMDVDVPTHTYSLYVTPPGGSETRVASGYAFRSESATVTSLTDYAEIVGVGGLNECGFSAI